MSVNQFTKARLGGAAGETVDKQLDFEDFRLMGFRSSAQWGKQVTEYDLPPHRSYWFVYFRLACHVP